MRPGRPPKLNAERAGIILRAVLAGLTQREAAARAGVSPSSLRSWRAQGRCWHTRYVGLEIVIQQALTLVEFERRLPSRYRRAGRDQRAHLEFVRRLGRRVLNLHVDILQQLLHAA